MSACRKRKQIDGDREGAPPNKKHKSIHSNYSNSIYSDGQVVWARLEEFPWWPGECFFGGLDRDKGKHETPKIPVRWFGEDSHCINWLTRDRIIPFSLAIEPQLLNELKVEDDDLHEYNESKIDAIAAQKKWQKNFAEYEQQMDADHDEEFIPSYTTMSLRNCNDEYEVEDNGLIINYNTRSRQLTRNNNKNTNNIHTIDAHTSRSQNNSFMGVHKPKKNNRCRRKNGFFNTVQTTHNSNNNMNKNSSACRKITPKSFSRKRSKPLTIRIPRRSKSKCKSNPNALLLNNRILTQQCNNSNNKIHTETNPETNDEIKTDNHMHASNIESNDNLNCRQIDVSNIQLRPLSYCKNSVLFDILDMDAKESPKIYKEQKDTAAILYQQMQDAKKVFFMVHAPPQSGKTTIINAIIEKCYDLNAIIETWVPPENWYVFTSLSDVAIHKQLKSRVPARFKPNVYHRGQLNKRLAEQLKSKTNVIIIWDEFHIAAKKGQTLDRFFEWTGWNDIQTLFVNNIRIIEISATPDGLILQQLKLDEENSCIVKMETGQGYVGLADLMDPRRNQIRKHKSLSAKGEIIRILRFIENQYKDHGNKLYHFIRVSGGHKAVQVKQQFEQTLIQQHLDYNIINFDQKSADKNINNIIKTVPGKHTLILIKELLRASVTLYHKNNCGVFYERFIKKVNDSVIVQSFAGRLCGYDVPLHCIIFTSQNSLERKKKLDESNFATSVPWESATTTVSKNKTVLKGQTYKNAVIRKAVKRKSRKRNSKSNINNNNINNTNNNGNNGNTNNNINLGRIESNDNNETLEDGSVEYDEYDAINKQYITIFDTFNKAKNFVKYQLGLVGQRKNFEQRDDGFFIDSVTTTRKNKRVLTPDTIKKSKKFVLGNSIYQQWVCYTNPKDKESVEFWVVWQLIKLNNQTQ